jgi:hypothetical protein
MLFLAVLICQLVVVGDCSCSSFTISFCEDVCDSGLQRGKVRELITTGALLDLTCLEDLPLLEVSVGLVSLTNAKHTSPTIHNIIPLSTTTFFDFQVLKIKGKKSVCLGTLPPGVLLLGECQFKKKISRAKIPSAEMPIQPFPIAKHNFEETVIIQEINKTGEILKKIYLQKKTPSVLFGLFLLTLHVFFFFRNYDFKIL